MTSPRSFFITSLKGFGMGAANVVPGVSGGTIALLTGIYQDIINSLNSLTEKRTWSSLFHGRIGDFWKCIGGSFLLALLVGVVASIFSLAKLMTWLLAYYPVLTWAFFFGLILASAFSMFRDIKDWKLCDVLFLLLGAVLGVAVCTLSPTSTPDDLWFIFICGAVAICTMILPGISGSFILLILGKYDYIMKAVTDLNIPVLAAMALGCVAGILAFSKFLHWLLGKWEKQTMIVLLGFVLGSLIKVWPWYDREVLFQAQLLRGGAADELNLQIPGAIICCVAGVAMVVVLDILGRRSRKS
ncbi:MAG TPA: DUF368 domain-containing protein [Rikenellaceae bacterium]|nr:DUF368 domain-containing protein [Rikenellaceae bacterium]